MVLLRLFIGGLFVYVGILKALDPRQFLTDIQNYQLLPYTPALMLAFYLPYLEIVCGISLFIKKNDTGALVLLLACMGVFILALCSAWVRGLDISCGCFSAKKETAQFAWWVTRDLLIAGLIAAAIIFKWERKPDGRSGP